MSSPASSAFFHDEFLPLNTLNHIIGSTPGTQSRCFYISAACIVLFAHARDGGEEKTGAPALAATKEVLCARTFISVTKMMQKSAPRSWKAAPARESVILRPCVNNLFECLSCSWRVTTPPNLCPNICFAHTHGYLSKHTQPFLPVSGVDQ